MADGALRADPVDYEESLAIRDCRLYEFAAVMQRPRVFERYLPPDFSSFLRDHTAGGGRAFFVFAWRTSWRTAGTRRQRLPITLLNHRCFQNLRRPDA